MLAIRIRRSERLRCPALKLLLIILLVVLCIPSDWTYTGLLMILAFDFYYGNFSRQAFAYCLIVIYDLGLLALLVNPLRQLLYGWTVTYTLQNYLFGLQSVGAFIPLALLSQYKGQRGKKTWLSKWFFYLYYPLHLLVLGFLQKVW